MAGPPYGAPIAADGIRARTARGSIGEHWWSRRFIDLLETFADQTRLRRGRSYARRGQVLGLRVEPYEVTAHVQGSEYEPYEVAIGIDVIDGADWRAIEADLAGRAVFRARLLAGEMPPEIESVFAAHGISLFPESAEDLHLMCSCPDWGDPCKHAAAVLYLLAEAFDTDPFLVLTWNGRTRDDLLTGLRRRPGPARADDAEDDPFAVDRPLTAEGFWPPSAELGALREQPPATPVVPDLLLRALDPPAIKIRRRPLTDVLAAVYAALPDA